MSRVDYMGPLIKSALTVDLPSSSSPTGQIAHPVGSEHAPSCEDQMPISQVPPLRGGSLSTFGMSFDLLVSF
jgi:hypothetical protein